jgi:hypothetical protein
MARKSVQGYTEKSYYDNTKFTGVAVTHDVLNEGIFRLLYNFDIAETGRSIAPRKGYITTSLEQVYISDNAIIFKDDDSVNYIIVDFDVMRAYVVDLQEYNYKDKYIPIVNEAVISGDIGADTVIHTLTDTYPEYIYDEHGVRKIYVRLLLDGEEVTTYTAHYNEANNELTFFRLNHEQPGSYVLQDRNIAFSGNIIPNPIQKIYRNSRPDDFISTVGNVYVRNADPNSEEYYINNINTNTDVLFIPHFELDKPTNVKLDTNAWAYSIEVTSTDTLSENNLDNTYTTGWIDLEDKTTRVFADIENMTDMKTDKSKDRVYKGAQKIITLVKQRIRRSTPVFGTFPYLNRFDLFQSGYNDRVENHYASRSFFDEARTELQELQNRITSLKTHKDLIEFLEYAESKEYMFLLGSTTEPNTTYEDVSVGARTNISNYDKIVPFAPNYNKYNNSEIRMYYSSHNEEINKLGYEDWGAHIITPCVELNSGAILRYTGVSKDTFKWTEHINSNTVREYTTTTNADKVEVGTEFTYDGNTYTVRETFFEGTPLDKKYNPAVLQTNYMWMPSKYCKDGDHVKTSTMIDGVSVGDAIKNNDTPLLLPYETEGDLPFIKAEDVIKFVEAGAYSRGGILDKIIFRVMPIKAKCRTYIAEDKVLFGFVYIPLQYFDNYLIKGIVGENTVWHLLGTSEPYLVVTEPPRLEFYMDTEVQIPLFVSSSNLRKYIDNDFFKNGYHIRFYFAPYTKDHERTYSEGVLAERQMYVEAGQMYTSASLLTYTSEKVTTIPLVYDKHVDAITKSKDYVIFEDTMVVTWSDNFVYISEPLTYYHYKEHKSFQFNERVVKVLPYKNILLVFTTQHLYALHRISITEEEKEQPSIWTSQQVLYNIATDEKYKKVIQVFNQMVLFYSAEGQLYLIKPNTMINSDTRFSLQLINSSANDFLLNYDEYINERLQRYGLEPCTREDVQIDAALTINVIRIYYTVAHKITVVLNYDIINNRYYLYDTIGFSNICAKMFIDGEEVLINKEHGNMLITRKANTYYDVNVLSDFKPLPIHTLMDTGTINLNNHLRKRFRDLRVTFKNIDAQNIYYNVKTYVDGITIRTMYDTMLDVQDINGQKVYTDKVITNAVDVANNTLLLDFKNYLSNVFITHRTNILGVGKTLRLCLETVAKGNYKIYGYSIVYKERRV